MSIRSVIYLSITLSMPLASLDVTAQDTGNPAADSAQSKPKAKTLNARFVALGHRRLARFKQSKEPKVVRIKTPDGDTIEEIIPAGVPLEVIGKKWEYLPSLVYVPNKNRETGDRFSISPLSLNACSQEKSLRYRKSLDVYLRQPSGENGGEMELARYFSTPIAEEQSHVVVALVNRYTESEGWRNPLVKSFDTSPAKLPLGYALVFNGTPYVIELDAVINGEMKILTVKPYKSLKLKPTMDGSSRTVMRARLVARNGSKRQFYYNSVRIKKDGRAYLFAYFDPRRQASNPAGMVQFSDIVELPEKKDG